MMIFSAVRGQSRAALKIVGILPTVDHFPAEIAGTGCRARANRNQPGALPAFEALVGLAALTARPYFLFFAIGEDARCAAAEQNGVQP